MNLENNVKDIITKKLEDGTIEKVVEEQFENAVINAMNSLFKSYGDVTKAIEDKLKAVMIPYVESYDFSEYIIKLDQILLDVLKAAPLENKKILENFSVLSSEYKEKTITLTQVFEKYQEFVEENVETFELEVNTDDGEPSYESVEIQFSLDYIKSYGSREDKAGIIEFTCEHDKKMNFNISVRHWDWMKKDEWYFDIEPIQDVNSLHHLNKFSTFLMMLRQQSVNFIIDSESAVEYAYPKSEPEFSFS